MCVWCQTHRCAVHCTGQCWGLGASYCWVVPPLYCQAGRGRWLCISTEQQQQQQQDIYLTLASKVLLTLSCPFFLLSSGRKEILKLHYGLGRQH